MPLEAGIPGVLTVNPAGAANPGWPSVMPLTRGCRVEPGKGLNRSGYLGIRVTSFPATTLPDVLLVAGVSWTITLTVQKL